MLKKFGAVAVGVGAGLVAMAPFASAGEAPLSSVSDSGSDGGSGSHRGQDPHDPHGHNNFTAKCAFNGGHADAVSDISGDTGLANAVAQAPTGGDNALNLLDCSSFLNNNANHNFSGNHLAVFGDDAVVK